MPGSSGFKVALDLRIVAPTQERWRPCGRVGGRGVNQGLLWQPGLPRWRVGKGGLCLGVAMVTQFLEASYEDKNHTLHTFKEVHRTSLDFLQSRELNGMVKVS